MSYLGLSFFLGRLLLGGYFLVAGLRHVFWKRDNYIGYAKMKKVSAPDIAVVGSGTLLLIGGAGIIFWTYADFAIWALLIFLVTTSFIMHAYWKESDSNMKAADEVNFWKNMALVGALLVLLSFT